VKPKEDRLQVDGRKVDELEGSEIIFEHKKASPLARSPRRAA